MKKIILLAIASLGLLTTSCATIFTGTTDMLSFNSTPAGAKVYIDGLEVCKTPCTMPIRRSIAEKQAEFKLDGYQTKIITLDREFNAVSLINMAGLFGWAIDAATGAVMKYGRKGYDVELERKVASYIEKADKIEVDTKNQTVVVYVSE